MLAKYQYIEVKYLSFLLQMPARNFSGKAKALKAKDSKKILGLDVFTEFLHELKFEMYNNNNNIYLYQKNT